MKILLLADSRSFHTERFAGELRRLGCRVLVASVERGRMLHFHLRPRGEVRTQHYIMSAFRARALLKRFKPDIINAHFASGYGFLASLMGHHPEVPYLLHVLGSDVLIVPHMSSLRRRKVRRALLTADCIVTDSDYLAEETSSLAPTRRIETIGWGVERAALDHHRVDYALGRPLRIIVPRGQEPVYNNSFIIDALKPLIREGKVKITFPASGSLLGEFRNRLSSLSDAGVLFYDRMPRCGFVPFMAGFDVCLSAAISDSSPTILIEAMALGLIPVAAKIPGVREWLSPDSGYLFNLGKPEELRHVIKKLISDNDPHTTMKQRNLEEVCNRGIFEENMVRQVELMRSLVLETRS
ncbi:MAG: glycosyltransferase [candidate division Zixibacteria bacterium]|nr:glycosyltransferase [candidate division Zixibacteria bacterium]